MQKQFTTNPTLFKSFKPATKNVMQDISYTNGHMFVTQAVAGSTPGTENVVLSKINTTTGKLEKMVLVDAGHGIGIEAKYADKKFYVFYSWGYRRHCRFIFKAGTYTFAQAMELPGATAYPNVNGTNEMLVKYDWANGIMICTRGEGSDSVFYRREVAEFRRGIDREFNHIRLSMGGDGTLQGFTGANNTFYRWLGAGGENNAMSKTDPIALEAYSWSTGAKLFRKTYPSLGKDSKGRWASGRCEPEGMTIIRESSGKASLLVGQNTGVASNPNRVWRAFRFKDIAAAI